MTRPTKTSTKPPAIPRDVVPEKEWADTHGDQAYVERVHDDARYAREDQRADAVADQW